MHPAFLSVLFCAVVVGCCNGELEYPERPTFSEIVAQTGSIFAADPDYASCLVPFAKNLTTETSGWAESMRTPEAYQTLVHRLADAQEGTCREMLKQVEMGFDQEILRITLNSTQILRRSKRGLPLIILGTIAADLLLNNDVAYAPSHPKYYCWDGNRRQYYECDYGRRKRQIIMGQYGFCAKFPVLCNVGGRRKRFVGGIAAYCARNPLGCATVGGFLGGSGANVVGHEYARWRSNSGWCSHWNGVQFVHVQC